MESITSILLEPDKIIECKLTKSSTETSKDNIKELEKSDIKSNGDVNYCFNVITNNDSVTLFHKAIDNIDSVDVKVCCKTVNDKTIAESHHLMNTLDGIKEIDDEYSDSCSNIKINHNNTIKTSSIIELEADGGKEPNNEALGTDLGKIVSIDQKLPIDDINVGSSQDTTITAITLSYTNADDLSSNIDNNHCQNNPHFHSCDRYSIENLNVYPSPSLPNNNANGQTMYSIDDVESQSVSLENISSFKGCNETLAIREHEGNMAQYMQELVNYKENILTDINSGLNVGEDKRIVQIDTKYEEENNFSNSLQEIGACITKISSESVTCMSDCTKVIFEGVCLDDSLISVSEDKTDTDISSSSINCYMQTVVEGTLQPLNVTEIKKAEQLKKDSVLFAAVSEELKQIDSESESERLEGIIVQSVENITNVNDYYNKDNVHLINLTEPPPIKLESVILKPHYSSEIEKSDDEKDDSKYASNKIDFEKYHNFSMPVEGKPFLLKILPLKNGHGLWFPNDLNLAIAEKGSVLLRLCAAPEAGDEDLVEGPQADFSALLLHEKAKVQNVDNGSVQSIDSPSIFKSIASNDEEGEDDDERIFAPPIIIETPKPLLPLSLISRQDFMERLQRPESPRLYEEIPLSLKWKVRNAASISKKRKCLSVPFTSVYRSKGSKPNTVNLTARGRRRGRPPLHNRGLIHNQFSTKRKFIEGPIKFRPPTPPSFLFSEESKDSVDLKNIPKKSFDPRTLCPSLAGLKKAAPGSILSKQMLAFKAETKRNEFRDESVSEACDDIINMDGEYVTVVGKITIPCEYCSSVFRKKSALTMHIKMRHRFLRKCPICKEVVRVRGKLGLKEHNLEAHSDIKSFQCEFCDESFQMNHQLKDHIKLTHDDDRNSDDKNSAESGSETDSKKEICINTSRVNEPKKSDKNVKVTNNLVKSDIENDSKLCKERMNAKDKRKIESLAEDSDSKESLSVTWEGRTRLRSKEQVLSEINVNNSGKSKEQDFSGESGNESDDEGEDSSGSSESEVEEPKNYFCSQCDEGFSHLFKLKHHHKERHSSSHHKNEAAAEEDVDDDVDDDPDDDSDIFDNSTKMLEGKYSCKICKKKCKSVYELRIHNLQHNLTLKQKGLRARRTSQSVEDLESVVLRSSKVCEKRDTINSDVIESNTTRPNLRGQKPSVSPISKNVEEKFKYPVSQRESNNFCNKFKVVRDKNRPAYIIRRGRMYYCTKCNINFKREKSMTYHLKKVHETLYPFRACPHCSRVFRSCGPYVRHLSQHTGKKCPVDGCKAKYKILRLIKKHQRHAHPDKPYRCSRCVELFVKEKELQNHVDIKHADKMKDDDEEEEDDDDEGEENDKISNARKTSLPGTIKVPHKKSSNSDDEETKKKVSNKDIKFAGRRKMSNYTKKEVEDEIEENRSKGKLSNGSKYQTVVGKQKSKFEQGKVEEVVNDRREREASFVPVKNFKVGSKRKYTKVEEEETSFVEDDNIGTKNSSSSKMLKSSKTVELLPIRRSRSMLVSYKEDDDDEVSSSEKLTSQQNSHTMKDSGYNEPELPLDLLQSSLSSESKELSINRDLPNSLCESKIPTQASAASKLISSHFTIPVVKQKRPYNRKVPYNKKRQEISWTAALKAKYGLNVQSNNVTTNDAGIATSSIYSPTITADVVRRVAESLLSRHQEQQQKQQEKLQKKLKKQQKKLKIASSIKYSSASTLPRIPYGSHLNSRDDSLSSFGDSSHTDQLSDYCSSSHSSVNKVPEEEDGGPAKVLRFDSF